MGRTSQAQEQKRGGCPHFFLAMYVIMAASLLMARSFDAEILSLL
jgi:hypothetical protein